ncbi:hypothetical protein IAQ61_009469 [Plenodomus lingam]|uniref:uncharacterized protein n=1 Tax=Leptosphaeria maculans TaxID=5022 RepID=UPI0033286737|nr:hypothetical protein IAQ61_009469 [Plenodomus lingam]
MPHLTPQTLLLLFLLPLLHPLAASTSIPDNYTNIPPLPPGIFTAQTRIHITTTLPAAWSALTNLPLYPTWNPFTRSATAIDPSNPITPPPQHPIQGNHLHMRTQIPPLPLPVDANTPDNPLHTQFAIENVTHVQEEQGRLAWAYLFQIGLQAERWQALTDLGNGTVLYESREEFHGPLAVVLKGLMGRGLQEAFEAQGRGLKLLLEGDQ